MHLLYGLMGRDAFIPLFATLLGRGIEWSIADWVIVFIGKNRRIRKWFEVRGYYFDYKFQDKWDDVCGDL